MNSISNIKNNIYGTSFNLINNENIKNIYKLTKDIFPNKYSYDIQIPLNIFQTWHTKKLSPKMFAAVNLIKKNNPRFKYSLYDDLDCREFIKNNFNSDVLYAYDKLIPGAYKADLWRYCILYKYGGIYLDIKYIPNNNFKFINLCESEHYVLDKNGIGIYNALMVSKPYNEFLLKAINQIVDNVKNHYYGECFLCPTGPKLLSKIIGLDNKFIDLNHDLINNNNKLIYYKNIVILRSYNGHIFERDKFSKKQHYAILWNNRRIYL